MSCAVQIYYSGFDASFFKFSSEIQRRIEAGIDSMGGRLGNFPHYRMTGNDRYRLRVGDYQIVYTFMLSGRRFTYWRWDIGVRFIGKGFPVIAASLII